MKTVLSTIICVSVLVEAFGNYSPVISGHTRLFVSEDAPIGTILGRLQAMDSDGPKPVSFLIKDDVTRSIISLGPIKQLSHRSSTVDLILKTELDRDFAPATRMLQVVATDGLSETVARLTLQIEDVNDVKPIFAQPEYKATVHADAPVGSLVLIVFASDPDKTYGGFLTYSIQTNDLFAYQAMKMDPYTGLVTTNSPLITHKGHDLHFQVVATDGGGLAGKANVTVTIQ